MSARKVTVVAKLRCGGDSNCLETLWAVERTHFSTATELAPLSLIAAFPFGKPSSLKGSPFLSLQTGTAPSTYPCDSSKHPTCLYPGMARRLFISCFGHLQNIPPNHEILLNHSYLIDHAPFSLHFQSLEDKSDMLRYKLDSDALREFKLGSTACTQRLSFLPTSSVESANLRPKRFCLRVPVQKKPEIVVVHFVAFQEARSMTATWR